MSRLYDRIMNKETVYRPEYGDQGILREPPPFEDVFDRLLDTVVINADNVAEYFTTQLSIAGGERGHWGMADFPSLAPPFPSFFIQFRESKAGAIREWGVLFCSGQIGADGITVPSAFVNTPLRKELGLWQIDLSEETTLFPSESLTWEVDTTLFASLDSGRIIGPLLAQKWLLSREGKNYLPGNRAFPILTPAQVDETMRADGWYGLLHFGIYPAFLAVSFMHCKNVVLADERLPRHERRRAERAGRPATIYKTLDIRPMQQVLRTEGDIEHTGLKRALHICRGHFATYSPDKPLFGRVTGTFWKPMHVRGSAKEGVVIKDYAVHKPVGVA